VPTSHGFRIIHNTTDEVRTALPQPRQQFRKSGIARQARRTNWSAYS
jgi:hypothetical protein